MESPPVVGRLAPSPTGRLHLGHAFSFLAAWWSARSQGGRVILRLEDVDTERSQTDHIDAALADLKWLGLDWDGPPVIQSERMERLREVALGLVTVGAAYPCVCTRGDLARAHAHEEPLGAPHEGSERPYPGTCRGRFLSIAEAEAQAGRDAGLRFLTPPGLVTVQDVVFQARHFDVQAEAGDFMILRRNKIPAYQLAVVVDDSLDGITEVVRGRDLLASAARQMLLADALDLPVPRYAHVPLVCDAEGRRLAKREAALGLRDLKSAGVRPEQIVAWAAGHLGQSDPGAGLQELARRFRWADVPATDIRLPRDWSEIF